MTSLAGGVNILGLVANTGSNSSNSSSSSSGTSFSTVLNSSVSDAQVSAALADNPGATPLEIYNLMKQSGVSIDQLSRVTGESVSTLEATANAAGITDAMLAQVGYASSSSWTSPFQATQFDSYSLLGSATAPSATGATDDQVKQWLAQNPDADAAQVIGTAQQYGVTLDQLSRVYGVVPNVLIQAAEQQGANVTGYTDSDLGWKSVGMDPGTFASRLANVGPLQLPSLLQAAGITTTESMTQMYGQQSSGGTQGGGEGAISGASQILNSLTPTQSRSLQDAYYAWANQQTQQNTDGQLTGLFGSETLTVANSTVTT